MVVWSVTQRRHSAVWSQAGWGSTAVSEASGCDRIPDLFETLKDDAIKALHSICQQIWKTQHWPQDWKRLILMLIPKKGSTKECSYDQTVALISHDNKVRLKILHARLQHYTNQKLPDVQAGFRKGRETRDQIANIHWIIKKARRFQKNIYFCFIDYVTCGKFLKRWEYQTTLLVSWET